MERRFPLPKMSQNLATVQLLAMVGGGGYGFFVKKKTIVQQILENK